MPMFCQHCDEAICLSVCPVNAASKDESLNRVIVDANLCVGCKACVSACPMGGVDFSDKEGKILRCDLCDGNPICVDYCETKAIQFIERDSVQIEKND